MIQLQALLKERSQNRQGQNTSKQKHPRLKQKSNPQNSQWLGQAANNQETRSNSPRYKNTKAKQGTTETYTWPSMVTHTRNLCSPSKCTQTAVNEHTPRAVGSPGSSWGFGALLKDLTSVVVLRVERALDIHSPPPPTIPAGPETRTRDLWIRSPTL